MSFHKYDVLMQLARCCPGWFFAAAPPVLLPQICLQVQFNLNLESDIAFKQNGMCSAIDRQQPTAAEQ
jgi:hypothetical protein